MATKKRSKTSSKKTAKKSSSKFKIKFNRTQALLIMLALAILGVVLVYHSNASGVSIATYSYKSPPMQHTTGYLSTNVGLRVAGKLMTVNTWSWNNYNNSAFQKQHFLQYGPYSTITLPSDKTGLHVCFDYATWNDVGKTGYVRVYTDLSYFERNLPWSGDEDVLEDPVGSDYILTDRSHCQNYQLRNAIETYRPPMKLTKVEFRFKVEGSKDLYGNPDHYGRIDLWRTTVGFY